MVFTLGLLAVSMQAIYAVNYRVTEKLCSNEEPAVLVHHSIVHRWRCGSLFTKCPL